MGFFKRKEKAPAEVERLDWKLLEHGAVTLYHKGSVLSGDLAWLRQHGYAIHELDASGWREPAAFHADAKRAFAFPSHYASNLASWIDCVAELPVPDEGGTAIVIRRYDVFAKAQPQLAQTILDSIESTSRRFLLTGRRLLALIQSDDPRIRFDRVGAVPVTWNAREWTDADRGLGRGD
ncbi:MAG TPA: barstar family protein [Gemmatimonadaceae bacterium]|nr:barstar family protein [Gemmatimonadaceae bacterium]